MATHSSILAWKICGQRSLVGYRPLCHKVRHNRASNTFTSLSHKTENVSKSDLNKLKF